VFEGDALLRTVCASYHFAPILTVASCVCVEGDALKAMGRDDAAARSHARAEETAALVAESIALVALVYMGHP
jgi:hypothetical protein